MPPFAHWANAEAIAGESSSTPPEELYLDGTVHVFPAVKLWAKTAEAPRPMVRNNGIIVGGDYAEAV